MTANNPANGTFTAGEAATVTFPDRYASVEVVNPDPANSVWARADGTAAVAGAAGCYEVLPNSRAVIANGLQFWWQGFGNASGTKTNPGTSVSLISGDDTSTLGYEVIGR